MRYGLVLLSAFLFGCSTPSFGPELESGVQEQETGDGVAKVVAVAGGKLTINAKVFMYDYQMFTADSVQVGRQVGRRLVYAWGARIQQGVARVIIKDGSVGPYWIRYLQQGVSVRTGRPVWTQPEGGSWNSITLPVAEGEVVLELPVGGRVRVVVNPPPASPLNVVRDRLPRGQRVHIPIEVTGISTMEIVRNQGIAGVQADIAYDPAVITPVRIVSDGALTQGFMTIGNPRYQGTPVWRVLSVLFSLPGGFKQDGVLFYLEVDVPRSAPKGKTVLNITNFLVATSEAEEITMASFSKKFVVE
jgi:hypothetical protein